MSENQFDLRPVPDPTLLTTQQLLRELAALKDLLSARMDGMERGYEAHEKALYAALASLEATVLKSFQAHERAIDLAKDAFVRTLADHDKLDNVVHSGLESGLAQARTEMVSHIAAAHRELELMIVGNGNAVTSLKESLALMIANAKEAITKAENSTDKQFNEVRALWASSSSEMRFLMPKGEVGVIVKSQDDKIDALKKAIEEQNESIVRLAANREGKTSGMHDGWGYAAGVLGFVLTILAVFSFFINRLAASAPK